VLLLLFVVIKPGYPMIASTPPEQSLGRY